MKKVFNLIFALFIGFSVYSQRFGNEWIDYSKTYIKFTVDKNGIYRIKKSDLLEVSYPVSGKLLRNYKLFFRGIEIPTIKSGNLNAEIQENDFIEFFGIKNDGKLEEELFVEKNKQPHNFEALYTDKTHYYLVSSEGDGKLIEDFSIDTGIEEETELYTELLNLYKNDWNLDTATGVPPNNVQSYLEPFEGLCSSIFYNAVSGNYSGLPINTKPLNLNISLPNYSNLNNLNTSFEAMIGTRIEETKNLKYLIGSSSGTVFIPGFNNIGKITIPSVGNISNSFNVNLTNENNLATNDFWSIYYYKIIYPVDKNLINNSIYYTKQFGNNQFKKISLNSAENLFAYVINDNYNPERIKIENIGSNIKNLYFLGKANQKSKIFATNNISTFISKKLINFEIINRNLYDFIMITDARLMDGTIQFKSYRESSTGGAHSVLIQEKENIYDTYSFGERNPIAIRRFIDYMTNTPKKIKNLFLIGKSYSKYPKLKLEEINDFVPTYGFPGSDVLLTSGLIGKPLVQSAVHTGRLSVKTNQEVIDYLNKVKEHESRTSSDFQKNLVHISGPKSGSSDGLSGEYFSLNKKLEKYRTIANNSAFGINRNNYPTFNIPTPYINNSHSSSPISSEIYEKINAGAGIINYFGHGTPVSTWHGIGYMSKTNGTIGGTNYIENKKYGLFLGNGCGLALAFDGRDDIASDWMKTKNKGSIISISQSYLSFEEYDDRFLTSLYNTIYGGNTPIGRVKSNYYLPIGDIFENTTNRMLSLYPGQNEIGVSNSNYSYIANLTQTIILGDPSIAIFKDLAAQPLSLTLLDIKVSNNQKSNIIYWESQFEKDFKKFEIEKSINGIKFQKIGEVVSKSNNSNSIEKKSYDFTDSNLSRGINYYRLNMINIDGSNTISKIVSIQNDLNKDLKLILNPTYKNEITFNLINLVENTVKFTNSNGIIINGKLTKANDLYIFKPNQKLASGIYFLNCKDSSLNEYNVKVLIK